MNAREAARPLPPPLPGVEGDDILLELLPSARLHDEHVEDGDAWALYQAGWLRAIEDCLLDVSAVLARLAGVGLVDVLLERREFGIEKYGRPLRRGDWRGLVDILQETVDAAGYARREQPREEVKS